MATKGEQTKENILAIAEGIILQKGFSGTSIDEIIAVAKITKGGFFYHFTGKNDLAYALVNRYLKNDEVFFDNLFKRARTLSEDPLQQMLIFINLLAEEMENLPDVHPGCLVASFTYESQQFDKELKELMSTGIISWRNKFLEQLENIKQIHPMKIEVSTAELADMLTAVVEGGIIVSRCLTEPKILVAQLQQYRSYLRLLFGNA